MNSKSPFSFFIHRRSEQKLTEDTDRRIKMIAAFTNPVKILLVDNRPDLRGAVALFLNQFNIDVYQAMNIGEAVGQAEAHEPDIVFVNMAIPLPSDGVTVIKELKARQPAVPVIAYAKDLNGDVGEALRSVAGEGVVPVPGEIALAEDFIHRILATFKLSRRAGMEPAEI